MADPGGFGERDLPPPFGLRNSGSTCHFNSLLQALAACPRLLRTAATMGETPTARAFAAYARACLERPPENGAPAKWGLRVLGALRGDLRRRRPRTPYGRGQESSSEGLLLLLEMLAPEGRPNPALRLFWNRRRIARRCGACQKKATELPAEAHICLELFDFDERPPADAEEFARHLLAPRVERLADYRCEHCGERGRTRRAAQLTLAPEIIVCWFNLYAPYGGRQAALRRARFFPPRFVLPARDGHLRYRQVAQVEHTGALDGGHYTARALRRAPGGPGDRHEGPPRAFAFNDQAVSRSALGPASGVYLVFYHTE
jgi:hypothetical protein